MKTEAAHRSYWSALLTLIFILSGCSSANDPRCKPLQESVKAGEAFRAKSLVHREFYDVFENEGFAAFGADFKDIEKQPGNKTELLEAYAVRACAKKHSFAACEAVARDMLQLRKEDRIRAASSIPFC